ncbi:hypothetical protein GCM10010103_75470 [Streptomyces paradoxus]|uniref:Uncharacterized protein n=1 Tax=Streptomyces paradoxus TaxID=66375 RepID=A0A7W9TJ03_9ACTN|nr:hypothetical protein [Streptomyces paradoxus]
MACDEDRGWAETPIPGLQVCGEQVTGMRLLGWVGILPLSVVRTVVGLPSIGGIPAPVPVPAGVAIG